METQVETESKVADAPPRSGLRLEQAAVAFILLCVLVFYWKPLFGGEATIQGDTADVHFPLQKYLSDRLFSGHLPFWTPYIFSGYPLLSNGMMGAWYPLHWPFLVAGITPQSIQWEIALHAALACLGTYFFLRRLLQRRSAALVGAFAYGLSGFFAANSAHLGVLIAAAWFPWLLYCYRRATESQKLRFAAVGALLGGIVILSGHAQAVIYAFVGLSLVAASEVVTHHTRWTRAAGIAAAVIAGSLLVASVQLFPAREISRHLVTTPIADIAAGDHTLQAKPVETLIWPNATGVISKHDRGTPTVSYFYGGMLLLPLAILGIAVSPLRARALWLILPALWFMLGPAAGLFHLGALLPVSQTGTPVYAWFLVAFALAVLTAAACDWIGDRSERATIVLLALPVVFFADLWYWNLAQNPLAYGRQTYQERYGRMEMLGRRLLAAPQLKLNRFDFAGTPHGVGPLLHPIDLKFETTYGYLLPESAYYHQYRDAMKRNPRLMDGLNVSRFLNIPKAEIEANISVLPRAYFPRKVTDILNDRESRQALETLNPVDASVVLPPHEVIDQDPNAEVIVNSFDEQSYRLHCTTQSPSLLKLSVPWYPGWRATIGSRRLDILRVDHALMGFVVPSGEHDITVTFAPWMFYPGAVLSVISVVLIGFVASGGRIYRRLDRLLFRDSEWSHKRRRRVRVRRSSI